MTAGTPRYWWLSFVDRAHDADMGSVALQLGVAIVLAADFETAVQEAWDYGCNPGGEAAGFPLGIDRESGRRCPGWARLTYRLLAEPDITEAQIIIGREERVS